MYDDSGYSNSSSFIWYETPIKIVFDQLVPAQGGQAKVNALYVAPRDSDRLYALDAETGARIWERPFGDSVPISGNANDYRWVAFSDNLAVIAQNTSPDRGGGAPSPAPDDSNGQYYSPRNIVLIDLSTGKEIDFHGHVPLDEGIGGRPVIIGRYIFVITRRSLIAYDSQQGDKIAIIRSFNDLANGDPILEIQIVGDKLLVFCSTRIFCYSLTPEGA
jgi:outer membrane protein assembly factor BamB